MKKTGTSYRNDNDSMGGTKDIGGGMNSSNSASLKGKLGTLEVVYI